MNNNVILKTVSTTTCRCKSLYFNVRYPFICVRISMKLFRQLLAAPAALGLLSPLTAANATNFNLNDVSNYSSSEDVQTIKNFSTLLPTDWSYKAITDMVTTRGCSTLIPSDGISRFEAAAILNSCLGNVSQLTEIESKLVEEFNPELSTLNKRLDKLEDKIQGFDASGFSSTTSASFGGNFLIGALDGEGTETVQTNYDYSIELTTSFTGDDSLDVAIIAGNNGGDLGEADLDGTSDVLTLDGISYTFPVGEKLTVMAGNYIDGSSLYNTACVYGGFTNTLDDCGNSSSAFETVDSNSVGVSAAYDLGGGYTAAFGYVADGTSGVASKAGQDFVGGQLSYNADQYGLSLTYSVNEASSNTSTATEEYLQDTTFIGLNGYWTPAETGIVPSISYGYESGDVEGAGENGTTQWFVGLQWDEVGEGVLGAAIGSNGAITEGTDELTMYEAFYSYPLNDGMTITPAVFNKETSRDVYTQGFMVKTSFEF